MSTCVVLDIDKLEAAGDKVTPDERYVITMMWLGAPENVLTSPMYKPYYDAVLRKYSK